jgi:hypothetical protein
LSSVSLLASNSPSINDQCTIVQREKQFWDIFHKDNTVFKFPAVFVAKPEGGFEKPVMTWDASYMQRLK